MSIATYLAIVRRRLPTVLVTTLAAAATGLGVSMMLQPTYEASATLRLPTPGGDRPDLRTALDYGDRLMNSFVELVPSGWVASEVAARVETDSLPELEAEVIANTELIRVTARHGDPEMAAASANALAALLTEMSSEWAATAAQIGEAARAEAAAQGAAPPADPPIAADITLTTVRAARPPEAAGGLSPYLATFLAGAVGLMGGLGLAFLRENLDPRIYDAEELRSFVDAPLLIRVPNVRSHGKVYTSLPNGRGSMVVMQNEFTRLALTLSRSNGRPQGGKAIMVVSARSGVGRSTVAFNLTAALAQIEYCVLAVDFSASRPVLHDYFGVALQTPDLLDALADDAPVEELVTPTAMPGVHLLPTGAFPLGADHFYPRAIGRMLEQCRKRYDTIIIDTPSLQESPNALSLSAFVDGALIVSDGSASRSELTAVVSQLRASEIKTLAVVANRSS